MARYEVVPVPSYGLLYYAMCVGCQLWRRGGSGNVRSSSRLPRSAASTTNQYKSSQRQVCNIRNHRYTYNDTYRLTTRVLYSVGITVGEAKIKGVSESMVEGVTLACRSCFVAQDIEIHCKPLKTARKQMEMSMADVRMALYVSLAT